MKVQLIQRHHDGAYDIAGMSRDTLDEAGEKAGRSVVLVNVVHPLVDGFFALVPQRMLLFLECCGSNLVLRIKQQCSLAQHLRRLRCHPGNQALFLRVQGTFMAG